MRYINKAIIQFSLILYFVITASCMTVAQVQEDIPREGLQLWLKADGDLKLVRKDSLGDGQTVIEWNDMSRKGNHAVRGAGADATPQNPTLVKDAVSGKPVVRFDGTDTWFTFLRITDMRSVFWVVSKDPQSFGQRNERFVFGDTGFGLRYNTDFHPGTHTKSYLLHSNTSAASLREGQVRLNGNLVDGVITDFPKALGVVSMISTANVTASKISYDRGYPGRCWQGDMAEIIVYNRVLTDMERAAVEKYLFTKYKIKGANRQVISEAWLSAAKAGATPGANAAASRAITVASVAISPDGRLIASASDVIKIYDANSGKLIRTLKEKPGLEVHGSVEGQPGQFTQVAFSPDGKRLAASSTDLVMYLWNADDGSSIPLKGALANPGVALWGFSFSPDGQSLLINNRSKGNDVRYYDVETGGELPYLSKPEDGWNGRLWALAYSKDGKIVGSSSENQTIRLWDTQTRKLIRTIPCNSVVWSFTFSPDGQTLAAAGVNMTLQLWNVATGKLDKTLSGHSASLTSVAYSADGRHIATGSDDSTVRIWDAVTGKSVRTLKAHQGGVWSVAFSPDGKTLISGGQDLTVKKWNYRAGELLKTLDAKK